MSRHLEIREGDYVRYTGSYSFPEGILRDAAIGRIDDFQSTHDNTLRIYLFILNKAEYVWCDFDKVRVVETEQKHLESCGYSADSKMDGNRFQCGSSIISRGGFTTSDRRTTVFTGFCVADFSKSVNFSKYLKNTGEFDDLLFDQNFPSVNNLNDLFEYLRKAHPGITLNWDKIANL